jgi:hypothetical protein
MVVADQAPWAVIVPGLAIVMAQIRGEGEGRHVKLVVLGPVVRKLPSVDMRCLGTGGP